MSINLTKGAKINLSKDFSGLNDLQVGLGWDIAKKKGLGGLLGGANFDLDASVVVIDDRDKGLELVYFGKMKGTGISHCGDNLTGAGDGDDEVINVSLSKLHANAKKLRFIVNIYQAEKRKQKFGNVENAFIRLVDKRNNQELCRYNLNKDFPEATGMYIGEIYNHNGEWKFAALEEGFTGGLPTIVQRYQVKS